MGKRTMNISRILFYYSLAVTAFLILIFVVFASTISVPKSNLPNYLFVLNKEADGSILPNDKMEIPVNNMYIVKKTNIENFYIESMLKNIPFLIVVLVGMLVIGSIVLSGILRRQNEKNTLLLAKELSRIGETNEMTGQHPAIVKAYQEIKEKLDAFALDYVRLSAYVTHEQKNILSLLRAKLQISGNTDLTSEVDKVTDSLDDILTLSATKSIGKTGIVDTALLCANVCDEFSKIRPGIHFNFEDDKNNMIIGRELWINRAVSNLVSNAIKYGGNGEIHVSVTNKKGSVIISVSDEGEGIDEAEQEKLFNYQYRVGKLKKDGYGIGLSLVRHVCELCDGLCWVENREKRGTTFLMVFPEALTID